MPTVLAFVVRLSSHLEAQKSLFRDLHLLLDRLQLENVKLGGGQGNVGRRFFVLGFDVGAHAPLGLSTSCMGKLRACI